MPVQLSPLVCIVGDGEATGVTPEIVAIRWAYPILSSSLLTVPGNWPPKNPRYFKKNRTFV